MRSFRTRPRSPFVPHLLLCSTKLPFSEQAGMPLPLGLCKAAISAWNALPSSCHLPPNALLPFSQVTNHLFPEAEGIFSSPRDPQDSAPSLGCQVSSDIINSSLSSILLSRPGAGSLLGLHGPARSQALKSIWKVLVLNIHE